jgi:hypothetical protein
MFEEVGKIHYQPFSHNRSPGSLRGAWIACAISQWHSSAWCVYCVRSSAYMYHGATLAGLLLEGLVEVIAEGPDCGPCRPAHDGSERTGFPTIAPTATPPAAVIAPPLKAHGWVGVMLAHPTAAQSTKTSSRARARVK